MSGLQVLLHESRTIEWWFEQFLANRLDLNPDFQRRSGLWSKYKRAHLIDSVLNGYDVPKFYVADFTLGRSDLNVQHRPYAVVDGKQRFDAFFSFFRDEFAINASSIYEAEPLTDIKGKTFETLKIEHPSLAAKILNFRPVVMSIITEDRQKISEMFVRLNSGEAANSAERRNAQPGPIPELVREIIAHAFFRNRISFNTKRMADQQLATKLFMMEKLGGAVDTKAANMDRFVKAAAAETAPSAYGELTKEQEKILDGYAKTRDSVITVLELLAEAFKTKDPLLSASGRIPVYYLAIKKHPEITENFRDFVEDFESRVISAMRMARDRTGFPDQRLLNYYTLSRTGNDQHSVRGRYETLIDELRKKNLISAKNKKGGQ
jgi:hypothetical protein